MRTLLLWRRVAAAALIALQGAIALSPMLERPHDVRRDAHVEALGSRHLLGHDEATCAVCSARTLVLDVPAEPAALFVATVRGRVAFAFAPVAHSTRLAPDNHSRAPPTLG